MTRIADEDRKMARLLFERAREDDDHKYAEFEIAACLAAARREGFNAGAVEGMALVRETGKASA